MKKTRAIVLGGGISGLSCAWELAKDPQMEVTLLEKEERVGGWIQTDASSEFFFESGPRFFKTSRYPDLLRLIDELGLSEKLLPASSAVKKRYVWAKGKLELVPLNLSAFLLSSLTRPFLGALMSEWYKPKGEAIDESVWEFVVRRFSADIAEYLFDPLLTGIYAGDIHKLSIRSCFPMLKQWEEKYGSVTKGFFREKRSKKSGPSSFFSLKGGVETLVRALGEELKERIVLGQEVKRLDFSGGEVLVTTQERSWRGDLLFSALPPHAIGELLSPIDQEVGGLLLGIPTAGLSTVQLGYKADLLPVQGAGYLVPSCEKEDILGVMFESSLFPQNNRHLKETRLGVLLHHSEEPDERLIAKAMRSLDRHLALKAAPGFARVVHSPGAIPQYEVGHQARIELLEAKMKNAFPKCQLLGNYLHGVSLNECVRIAAGQVGK